MIDDALIVRTSPFHDRTSLACFTNAWTNVAGTSLVSVYRNVEQEYWAMYKRAALVDVSYHIALRITGAQAVEALDHLTVAKVGELANGSFCRTLWCTDEGHVVGDGLLLREDPASFLIVTRVPCEAFIAEACAAFDCAVVRADDLEAGLELVGPKSAEILEGAGFSWAPALHPGSFVTMTVRGLTAAIACLDRGGTPAFAVWTSADGARLLWDRLRRAGGGAGIMAAGLAAHTVLRLENAEPAYSLDYIGALRAPSWRQMATPAALGLEGLIGTSKTRFNGARALAKAAPPRRHLVTLAVEGAGALAPAFVTAEGLPVGHVTSAAWSPRLGCGLVIAWVETEDTSLLKGLRIVSPVRGAAAELTEASRDGRPCHLYTRP